jgi:metal-responsive CopG/Arc/MetJ family transcriptional regulator
MKTAISLPNDVFAQADALARRTQKSRSQLVCEALREYVSRHAEDEVTARLDRTLGALDEAPDGFVAAAAARTLEQSEW